MRKAIGAMTAALGGVDVFRSQPPVALVVDRDNEVGKSGAGVAPDRRDVFPDRSDERQHCHAPAESMPGGGNSWVMNAKELSATVGVAGPPDGLSPLLEALWWDAKGDWSRAHQIAQEISSPHASWVHAYLHRKEGDASNAGYWYRRAGKSHSQQPLEAEWNDIAEALLAAPAP